MSQNCNERNHTAILKIISKNEIIPNNEQVTIVHLLSEGQTEETFDETIEIFKNPQENYKISLQFSLENNQLTLDSLILEELESESSNWEPFWEQAESKLLSYFNKIKFMYSFYPQDVCCMIVQPEETSGTAIYSDSCIDNSFTQVTHPFNRVNYKKLASTSNADIDRYIDHYLKIKESNDPILCLVMSYWLYELIGHNMNATQQNPVNREDGKFYIYYSVEESLKIERLAKSARNLVSHGVVESRDTLQDLNDHFGTNLSSHTFDRKNEQHMDLVRWAAEQFLSVIKNYISSKILPEELRRKEHKIIRLEESN
jgi:hypothetical protein